MDIILLISIFIKSEHLASHYAQPSNHISQAPGLFCIPLGNQAVTR